MRIRVHSDRARRFVPVSSPRSALLGEALAERWASSSSVTNSEQHHSNSSQQLLPIIRTIIAIAIAIAIAILCMPPRTRKWSSHRTAPLLALALTVHTCWLSVGCGCWLNPSSCPVLSYQPQPRPLVGCQANFASRNSWEQLGTARGTAGPTTGSTTRSPVGLENGRSECVSHHPQRSRYSPPSRSGPVRQPPAASRVALRVSSVNCQTCVC